MQTELKDRAGAADQCLPFNVEARAGAADQCLPFNVKVRLSRRRLSSAARYIPPLFLKSPLSQVADPNYPRQQKDQGHRFGKEGGPFTVGWGTVGGRGGAILQLTPATMKGRLVYIPQPPPPQKKTTKQTLNSGLQCVWDEGWGMGGGRMARGLFR